MKKPPDILIDDFDYTLDPGKIALSPYPERDGSKLLIYSKGRLSETFFRNLADQLAAGTSLVLNDSRVIHARLFFLKDSGARIEIFCLEPFNQLHRDALMETSQCEWLCLIGGASKWKKGQVLHKKVSIDQKEIALSATFVEKKDNSFRISFTWDGGFPFLQVLKAAGSVPLPPYIKREANKNDPEHYQTVFAREAGSVAAPTAALHFTPPVFDALRTKQIHPLYVTLHVGAGTFLPVKSETIAKHPMHVERFSVRLETLSGLLEQQEIVAVGTTSLRTLESLYWLGVRLITTGIPDFSLEQWEAYELNGRISFQESISALVSYLEKEGQQTLYCDTRLIIVPGYQFHSAKGLITNFHQPRSTLLLLIAAFIGEDWKKVYQHALENEYRFLSYGDSSLLWRSV